MRSPTGVAVDFAGNVYVADFDNDRIQKFSRGVAGWTQMNFGGFGDRGNGQVSALAAFNSELYAGTTNRNAAQLWRTTNGTSWSPVMTNGFGNSKIYGFDDLVGFDGQLYASLSGCGNDACTISIGGQIWRSANGITWSPVLTDGFRYFGNGEIYNLAVLITPSLQPPGLGMRAMAPRSGAVLLAIRIAGPACRATASAISTTGPSCH